MSRRTFALTFESARVGLPPPMTVAIGAGTGVWQRSSTW